MTTMRFSVMEWCSRPAGDSPAEFYRRVRALGYDAVELPSLDAAAAVQAVGLTAANVAAPGFSEGLCRRENHAALVPQMCACVEQAKERGIGQVIVFSGDARGVDEEDGLRACVDGLKRCAPVAEKLGVTLIFEMFNAHDHPGNLAVSSRFGFDLARAVSSTFVKVLYDIYHMQRMGENPLRDLTTNLEYVAHVHIAGSPRRDFPGADQQIDYRAIVKQLTSQGYHGFWGMEFYARGDIYQSLADARTLFLSYC